MIEIKGEQLKWIKYNYCLSNRDMPTEFVGAKELLNYVIGKEHFRGMEHHRSQSDLLSFAEECYMAATASKKNKNRMQKVFNQFEYLISECKELEYYELLSNLKLIHECFIECTEMYNREFVNELVSDLLNELSITKEN